MIDSYYRAPFQKVLVNPLVDRMAQVGILPQNLTLAALMAGLLAILPIAWGLVPVSIAFIILSGYFDVLDGSLARKKGCTSPQGAVLDIISDRIVEFGIILGLFFYDPQTRGLICLLLLGSVLICVTSFLVVGIFTQNNSNKSFYYSPGIMERSEAFIFFILMIILPKNFVELGSLFAFLTTLTGLVRVRQFMNK